MARSSTLAMAILVVAVAPGGGFMTRRLDGRAAPAIAIAINENRIPAGTLRDGILTIRLDAREGQWHPEGAADPGIVVRAFAQEGQQPSIPAPLIRVPQGTEVRAFVRNSLVDRPLVVHGLVSRKNPGRPGSDTVSIAAGQVREIRFVADKAGTYYYWGTTTNASDLGRPGEDSQLSGAFIVDPPGASEPAPDRVFVIGLWTRQIRQGGIISKDDVLRFVINGKSWPHTERLTYTVGDSVRLRVVNTSAAVHPMHLHGFYFNVDSRGDGLNDTTYGPGSSPRLVVTERAGGGRTFTMTWVPERPGNWMFHCHDNYHVLRNAPLDGTPRVKEHTLHVQNHALEMMGGLVMGIAVRPKDGAVATAEESPRRRLRLIARVDAGGNEDEPSYGYVLQEGATITRARDGLIPGPTIVLERGQPVSITVVNELREATAVHWHGIELDSYYDGVAGFAGHPGRIAPAIAPADSFEARFTPPRAGTFIYHPHADEVRQQKAGLSGAIVVLEPGEKFDPEHDIVLLVTAPRQDAVADSAVFINGTTRPSLQFRVGERYRLRIVNIHTFRPSMIARLLQDSTPVTWRAVAKDGMVLPPDQATIRPAVLQLGNGETYDFELTPPAAGNYRFTMSSAAGQLLITMPVSVK